jgi:hypothetical protein
LGDLGAFFFLFLKAIYRFVYKLIPSGQITRQCHSHAFSSRYSNVLVLCVYYVDADPSVEHSAVLKAIGHETVRTKTRHSLPAAGGERTVVVPVVVALEEGRSTRARSHVLNVAVRFMNSKLPFFIARGS